MFQSYQAGYLQAKSFYRRFNERRLIAKLCESTESQVASSQEYRRPVVSMERRGLTLKYTIYKTKSSRYIPHALSIYIYIKKKQKIYLITRSFPIRFHAERVASQIFVISDVIR